MEKYSTDVLGMVLDWTLGQQAYAAYWHRWPALALPWARLTLRERRCWEAAARAAVAAREAQQTRDVGGRGE